MIDAFSCRLRHRAGWRVDLGCLAAAIVGLVLLTSCGGAAALTGTDLGGQPAPNFTLTDQRGDAVSLADFRGKAVVLTFIHTHCPDVCPATAEHLRETYAQLPPGTRDRVAFLAVTVDPARDTPAALRAFAAQHGLDDNPAWFALTGDRTTLAAVWRDYGIDPGAMMMSPSSMPMPTPAGGTLAHTDAVYLIDPAGHERTLLHSDLDSARLAADLQTLTR